MPQSESRLTLGYHLTGNHADLADILSPNVAAMSSFLREISAADGTAVSMYAGVHPTPPSFFSYRSVRIQVSGQLVSIRSTLDKIVQREGVPDFVDKPQPRYPEYDGIVGGLLYGLFGLTPVFLKLNGQSQKTPTTLDAYDSVKEIYVGNKVKTKSLTDNTLVPSSHTYF